jgi:hypothetical protein
MAGIKISDLPAATTPLAGTEQFALVQSSCTKVATLDDISDALGDTYATLTLYSSTSSAYTTMQTNSADWDSGYSSYLSMSANYAQLYQPNHFTCPQSFTKVIAGQSSTAPGAYASTIGGYYNDARGGGSVVAGGNNNDACANFSFIGGGEDNVITSIGEEGAVIGGNCNILSHARSVIAGGTCVESVSGCMLHIQSLYIKSIPTSDPGVPGVVWNNNGCLMISVP